MACSWQWVLGTAEAPSHYEASRCAEGPPVTAAGRAMRLSLQIAGVAVGSPITLGPGGTFTGTFPAPANGGTYVVRTDYTPAGATAAVASFAANLVVNGGSGGTTPLTLTIGFGNGANGQPPISLGHAQTCKVPSIYMCTEHSRLACTTLELILPETSRYGVGVLLHGHFSSMKSWAVALQHAINNMSCMRSKRGSDAQSVPELGYCCVHGMTSRYSQSNVQRRPWVTRLVQHSCWHATQASPSPTAWAI